DTPRDAPGRPAAPRGCLTPVPPDEVSDTCPPGRPREGWRPNPSPGRTPSPHNLATIVGLPCPRLARGRAQKTNCHNLLPTIQNSGDFHVRYRYRWPRPGPGCPGGQRADGDAAHRADVRDPLFPDDPSADEAPEGTPQP